LVLYLLNVGVPTRDVENARLKFAILPVDAMIDSVQYSRSMVRLKYWLPPLFLCLLFAAAAAAEASDSYFDLIEAANVSTAGPPRYVGSKVLLSYTPPYPVRLVGARFAHEDFRVFHKYSYNEKGVFVLLLDVPREVDNLLYRISVDGVWMNDPFNPETRVDTVGTTFSRFSLEARPEPPLRSPRIEQDGRVTFVLRSQPGRRVYLVGDFNQWDPFWDRMPEVRPGLYRLSLLLNPGVHYYLYSVDGQNIQDPLNLHNAAMEGTTVSMLAVPAQGGGKLSLYQTGDR
jgi:hypothetical protein